MKKSPLSILALGAVLTAVAPAQAQSSATQTVSERVSHADLDLATPQGVATLDRRLAGAIRRVCGPIPAMSLVEDSFRRRCLREARSGIRPQRALAIAAARRGDEAVRIAVVRR